ncbi:hypothetical protein Hamer_G000793 [Homarus americanus]|uniref:Uncharacterized protein n=1 Tax=Homarus americanus TaxID=6706 RepID=A0A8J5N252_HOMAM|nr:hypothetical protein Hamer_G000793 [Homarus americanus]
MRSFPISMPFTIHDFGTVPQMCHVAEGAGDGRVVGEARLSLQQPVSFESVVEYTGTKYSITSLTLTESPRLAI